MEHRAFHGSRYKRGGMMIGVSRVTKRGSIHGPTYSQRDKELGFHRATLYFDGIRSFFGNQGPRSSGKRRVRDSLPNRVPSDGPDSNGSPEQRHGVADRVRRILTLAPARLFSSARKPEALPSTERLKV